MIAYICSFTKKGMEIQEKVKKCCKNVEWVDRMSENSLKKWTSEVFFKRFPLVFVGAVGIAVRTIAEFVYDKLTDSSVVVIDEAGKFVIPVLSGHAGGANELARMIAEKIGAMPVITTATDVENAFAADVFAVKNGLRIMNREGIKKVSAKALNGEKLTVWIDSKIKKAEVFRQKLLVEAAGTAAGGKNGTCNGSFEVSVSENQTEAADIVISDGPEAVSGSEKCLLWLSTKKLCAGIGCKKGKTFEELKEFLEENISEEDLKNLASISSVDLKKNESGLKELAQYYRVPFITYTAEQLMEAKGDFSASDFVKNHTGTDNVCERAAVLSAEQGELLVRKVSKNGMTFAVARQK